MWKLYYDFDQSGVKLLLFPFLFLIFLVPLIYIIVGIKKGIVDEDKYPLPVVQVIMTGVILFGLFVAYHVYSDYFTTKNILANSQYEIIEGVVENFEPKPIGGRGHEKFTIKNIEFQYSDAEIGEFNKTKANGGPIRADRYVRVHHYKGRILRLWVKE